MSESVFDCTWGPEGRCHLFREHWSGILDLFCLHARDRFYSKPLSMADSHIEAETV